MHRTDLRPALTALAVVVSLAGCGDDPSDSGSAGTPTQGSSQTTNGGAMAELSCPDGLAVDQNGTLYVADVCANRVLSYSPDDGWQRFAGTGRAGYAGDGGPAAEAKLNYVGGVVVDGEGTVYLAECGGNVVRMVTPDRVIGTVAGVGGLGAGNGGYAGDGGPATEAKLFCASDAAVDAAGNLYIVDRDNSVVRRVDASGVITTIAGGGTLDTSGARPAAEGMSATEARFPPESPVHVVVAPDRSVYLADEKAHRVWRVDPTGVMSTVAGTGVAGYSGDDGPADQAQLNGPYGLALDQDGNLYVGDYENARVRRIDPSGIITTVAGSGEVGTAGDGGPATKAQLHDVYGLTVDAAGSLYIADQENALIRIVDSQGVIRTLDE